MANKNEQVFQRKVKVKVTQSCPTLYTGMGSLSLLQGIFPTQGSNPGLPHCRQILYQLSHKGSPRMLEWVAYPFSRDLPNPGIKLSLLHCRQILHQLSYQGSPESFFREKEVQMISPLKRC